MVNVSLPEASYYSSVKRSEDMLLRSYSQKVPSLQMILGKGLLRNLLALSGGSDRLPRRKQFTYPGLFCQTEIKYETCADKIQC